jgi:hypothetical protein
MFSGANTYSMHALVLLGVDHRCEKSLGYTTVPGIQLRRRLRRRMFLLEFLRCILLPGSWNQTLSRLKQTVGGLGTSLNTGSGTKYRGPVESKALGYCFLERGRTCCLVCVVYMVRCLKIA